MCELIEMWSQYFLVKSLDRLSLRRMAEFDLITKLYGDGQCLWNISCTLQLLFLTLKLRLINVYSHHQYIWIEGRNWLIIINNNTIHLISSNEKIDNAWNKILHILRKDFCSSTVVSVLLSLYWKKCIGYLSSIR